jgi:hypothetical protein
MPTRCNLPNKLQSSGPQTNKYQDIHKGFFVPNLCLKWNKREQITSVIP